MHIAFLSVAKKSFARLAQNCVDNEKAACVFRIQALSRGRHKFVIATLPI
jgi:hypothetical protein